MAQGALRDILMRGNDSYLQKVMGLWNNELCAEHDGTICSFPSLSVKLDDIDLYPRLFARNVLNVVRAAKYAGYGATGVLTAAGLVVTGGAAGPFAAALGKMGLLGAAGTGTAISTLSGAALTNASLAAIGGTIATGTAVITAVGGGLGGIQGGVIASRYHSDDPSFTIRALNDIHSDQRTIYINGFMEQLDETFEEWTKPQLAIDPNQRVYGVTWSSKTKFELGTTFAQGVGTKIGIAALKDIAKRGGKTVAKGLNPLFLLDAIGDLIGNPWHTSMVRAAQAGVQLAEALSRTSDKQYTLVGHSLGCRVIYYALEALSTKREKYVTNVVLLGGAVGRKDHDGWTRALDAVSGKILNCYSSQDMILDRLYRTANAGLSDPIGVRPIELINPKLVNINCTDFIESHMTWKPKYTKVIDRIRESGA
jgi:hypothetical protein